MSSEPQNLCIILARGGSKRVPRKNVRPLNGKPLISYTIESAIESKCFSAIVISTDDKEIADVAAQYDVEIDWRPSSLSGDQTKAVEVVWEYLTRHPDTWDVVSMMLPTCPFRNYQDVQSAITLFEENGSAKPVMSVTQYEFPPQLAVLVDEHNGQTEMVYPEEYARTTRSQSIESRYHPNGAIYISSVSGFIKEKTFFKQPMLSYVMPPERSFDIDYPYQMRIAELLAKDIV
jgi:CMP-N-acetylneuraminic acid synthetase